MLIHALAEKANDSFNWINYLLLYFTFSGLTHWVNMYYLVRIMSLNVLVRMKYLQLPWILALLYQSKSTKFLNIMECLRLLQLKKGLFL